ncbi:MAG: hypothetical protein Ct9H300mP26_0870 [Acidimicrobiales bacterium]|nr:MAG: hypothetical protein Ct9H300mP26_0870 [Acidimicrobiales bacterium]
MTSRIDDELVDLLCVSGLLNKSGPNSKTKPVRRPVHHDVYGHHQTRTPLLTPLKQLAANSNPPLTRMSAFLVLCHPSVDKRSLLSPVTRVHLYEL